jgi:hypothetical protein
MEAGAEDLGLGVSVRERDSERGMLEARPKAVLQAW